MDNSIWVSIDETTDVRRRYRACVMISNLLSENSTKPIIFENFEKANFQMILKLFNGSMNILWSEKVLHNKVLIYVTDAVPYIIRSGKALKVFYPKLTHITCMAYEGMGIWKPLRINS